MTERQPRQGRFSYKLGPKLTVNGEAARALDTVMKGGDRSLAWRGRMVWKNPLDLMIYQEIVHEVRPSLVIETGSHQGGSALFWSDMLKLNGVEDGEVLSIDVKPVRPVWGDVRFLTGSSLDEGTLIVARSAAERHRRVLVNLDSDHTEDHVRAELEAYAPLVTVGSYVIVEDGVDDFRWQTPGPYAACVGFLAAHPEFKRDAHRERLRLGNNPCGFLRRMADDAPVELPPDVSLLDRPGTVR